MYLAEAITADVLSIPLEGLGQQEQQSRPLKPNSGSLKDNVTSHKTPLS